MPELVCHPVVGTPTNPPSTRSRKWPMSWSLEMFGNVSVSPNLTLRNPAPGCFSSTTSRICLNRSRSRFTHHLPQRLGVVCAILVRVDLRRGHDDQVRQVRIV